MPRAKVTQATADRNTPNAPLIALTKASTKSATIMALLAREQGATLAELIEATGWLPHTTRAALTGLKKKGHTIERRKREDITCYHLLAADV